MLICVSGLYFVQMIYKFAYIYISGLYFVGMIYKFACLYFRFIFCLNDFQICLFIFCTNDLQIRLFVFQIYILCEWFTTLLVCVPGLYFVQMIYKFASLYFRFIFCTNDLQICLFVFQVYILYKFAYIYISGLYFVRMIYRFACLYFVWMIYKFACLYSRFIFCLNDLQICLFVFQVYILSEWFTNLLVCISGLYFVQMIYKCACLYFVRMIYKFTRLCSRFIFCTNDITNLLVCIPGVYFVWMICLFVFQVYILSEWFTNLLVYILCDWFTNSLVCISGLYFVRMIYKCACLYFRFIFCTNDLQICVYVFQVYSLCEWFTNVLVCVPGQDDVLWPLRPGLPHVLCRPQGHSNGKVGMSKLQRNGHAKIKVGHLNFPCCVLRLYGVGHMVKEGRKEMFYLTNFNILNYMQIQCLNTCLRIFLMYNNTCSHSNEIYKIL